VAAGALACGGVLGWDTAAGRDWLAGCDRDTLPPCLGSDAECALFDRINCERSIHVGTDLECSHGLVWDEEAAAAARVLAEELAAAEELEHDDWGRQNLSIAQDADQAMDGLMLGESEPHCETADTLSHHCNNMHCDVASLGVAAAEGDWGGYGTYTYYAMNFR